MAGRQQNLRTPSRSLDNCFLGAMTYLDRQLRRIGALADFHLLGVSPTAVARDEPLHLSELEDFEQRYLERLIDPNMRILISEEEERLLEAGLPPEQIDDPLAKNLLLRSGQERLHAAASRQKLFWLQLDQPRRKRTIKLPTQAELHRASEVNVLVGAYCSQREPSLTEACKLIMLTPDPERLGEIAASRVRDALTTAFKSVLSPERRLDRANCLAHRYRAFAALWPLVVEGRSQCESAVAVVDRLCREGDLLGRFLDVSLGLPIKPISSAVEIDLIERLIARLEAEERLRSDDQNRRLSSR